MIAGVLLGVIKYTLCSTNSKPWIWALVVADLVSWPFSWASTTRAKEQDQSPNSQLTILGPALQHCSGKSGVNSPALMPSWLTQLYPCYQGQLYSTQARCSTHYPYCCSQLEAGPGLLLSCPWASSPMLPRWGVGLAYSRWGMWPSGSPDKWLPHALCGIVAMNPCYWLAEIPGAAGTLDSGFTCFYISWRCFQEAWSTVVQVKYVCILHCQA